MRIPIEQANQQAQAEFRRIQEHTEYMSQKSDLFRGSLPLIPAGEWKITGHSYEKSPKPGEPLSDWVAIHATSPDGRRWDRHFNEKDRTWGGWVEEGVVTNGATISRNSVVFGPEVRLSPDTTLEGAQVGPYTETKGTVEITGAHISGLPPGHPLLFENPGSAHKTVVKDSHIFSSQILSSDLNKASIACGEILYSTVDDGKMGGHRATLIRSVLSGGSIFGGYGAVARNSFIRDGSEVDGTFMILIDSTVEGKSRMLGDVRLENSTIKEGSTVKSRTNQDTLHIEDSTVEGGLTVRHDLIDNCRPTRAEYKRLHTFPYQSPGRHRTQEK